ncbi:3-methyl-2-oxobutanoate hydroxymethyltransferase [Pseudomonas sp. NW5]|uniref:3-methyl-2-oxobutanoate hydroxymethyltransferase n=1 Tax=Pseudomonas sp. NW5 TaxID=2934934 RepID=UPI0020227403|nr:3-methyl-2-oxobutanoate hydroxymethyltransferase [Pseudomonas sp. NW5]MCL7461980.1 3-methyl-2-oxobutanoate hydroxymethyltransferase [Pseudomonas sp. NW5]
MPDVTLTTLRGLKERGEKIVMLTSYDATFAAASCAAGVEVLLVGDSLGNVLQGHDSTLPVSVADMAYHTACVKRGNRGALVLADLPFMSYATLEQALESSAALMRAGAHMVKLEGSAWLCETVRRLADNGIPACVHLGLTPQSVNVLGGYKVQGRDEARAREMREAALALEEAGAAMLLLECVPSPLAGAISRAARVPVIGIGAGPDTDGQVLVLHDLLGLNPRPAKFVRNFMTGQGSLQDALAAYTRAVKDGQFPAPEHGFSA